MNKKPFVFVATIGAKPFKVQIDMKQGMVVTGLGDKNDYYHRFTKYVPVKKGDVFEAAPGRGLILNGQLVECNLRPRKRYPIRIGWVPKRLRLAVFFERDRIWHPGHKDHGKLEPAEKGSWMAADTRGYWVSGGKTPVEAVRNVLFTIKATDLMEREDRQKGRKVIRWHVERTKGTRKELLEMEKAARKTGFILEGVDWRASEPEPKWS